MLSDAQQAQYRETGYLLLESTLSDRECRVMAAEADRIGSAARDERILEVESPAIRSLYNLHKTSPMFGRLIADRRILEPASTVLGGDLYVHQAQLNPKAAFTGENWEWHQDFLFWQREDGMQRPEAANAVVYLDPMTVFNGPLFLVPGSHLDDYDAVTPAVADGWHSTLTKSMKHAVSHDAVAAAVARHGMVAPLGPPGSLLLFDPRLLHGSPSNISPYRRSALFIRYNRVDNSLSDVATPRPEWVVDRAPVAIRPLAGTFLQDLVTSHFEE